MNGLAGHVVVTQLCRQPVEPYEGIAPTPIDVDVRGLARLLGLPQKALRAGLARPGGSRSMSRHLRYCQRCMTLGYHGVVHQFLGAMQCPVHGDWLEEGCRVCGAHKRLSARRAVARCAIPACLVSPVARPCAALAHAPCPLVCARRSRGPTAGVEDMTLACVADCPTGSDTFALRRLAASAY